MDKEEDDEVYLFEKLIITIYTKINKQVVLLIDEYDKPILDLITDNKEAEEARKILKEFYNEGCIPDVI
jgi:pentatricopeptide repeat protein